MFIQSMSKALDEFQELIDLALQDPKLAKTLYKTLEPEQVIIIEDVIHPANSAGDVVVSYKLPENLAVLLATVRAEGSEDLEGRDESVDAAVEKEQGK